MNRQEFLHYMWKQCRKTCETVISWRFEPLADALEIWDETQWVEVSPYQLSPQTPVFFPAGKHMVVLLAEEEGEGVRAWDARCPHCHIPVYWQAGEKVFRCPQCLKDFGGDVSAAESLQPWPVRRRQGKIYVAKEGAPCMNSL